MTPQELSDELARMYHDAPQGEAVVMIHLFGIRYADRIRRSGESIRQIVQRSGIPLTYVTEVNKMVNLARYVVPRT